MTGGWQQALEAIRFSWSPEPVASEKAQRRVAGPGLSVAAAIAAAGGNGPGRPGEFTLIQTCEIEVVI